MSVPDCVLVGRPNSGKTLFLINLCEHLGCGTLELETEGPAGGTLRRRLSPEEARRLLVGGAPQTTVGVQRVLVRIRRGKSGRECRLVDTTGLVESVHPDESVRWGMASSIGEMLRGRVVLHLVDASLVREGAVWWGELEEQMDRYLSLRPGYAVLANKMDLPEAEAGLRNLLAQTPARRVFPVSALTRAGFREVVDFVRRHVG